jgi:PAS domain S-box-containing protein
MKPLHNLLKQQLQTAYGGYEDLPPTCPELIAAINEAYHQADEDRQTAERSLAISSQELNQANSELRAIFQALPDLFFRLDLNGRVLDFKSASENILCAPAEHFIGQRVQTLWAEAGEQYAAALARLRNTRQAAKFEYSLALNDGLRFFEARLLPLTLPHDEQAIALIRDITEAKHTEYDLLRAQAEMELKVAKRTAELSEANATLRQEVFARQQALQETQAQLHQAMKMEAMGRLAGGVAHDFNNLLTAILGYSELIAMQLNEENESLLRQLKEITKAANRAATLARQLLAFSRKQLLRPQILDVNTVVRDMDLMLRRLIDADIEFVYDLACDLEPVRADRTQLEQVLLNLCLNARDAMPRGGRLTVKTANAQWPEPLSAQHENTLGSGVMLEVRDTGVGMDLETKTRLFEPFFTTKAPGQGTGLGLASVYGVIRQSGGHITVESSLGCGAVFKVYLPRCAEPTVTNSEFITNAESSDRNNFTCRGRGIGAPITDGNTAIEQLSCVGSL